MRAEEGEVTTSTVADRPGAKRGGEPPPDLTALEPATVLDRPTPAASQPGKTRPPTEPTLGLHPSHGGSTLTTAADAMRDEEVERTRLFIRLGWVLSVGVIGTVFVLGGPLVLQIAVIAGMVIGMIVSFGYHQAWADPQRYTDAAILRLSIMCVLNGHLAVLYYGVLTIAPVCIVIGIHFIGRNGDDRN